MKLFLFTTIAAPIVDLLANDGRCIAIALAHLASLGSTLAAFGAAFMPAGG